MSAITAEELFQELKTMPASERNRFFTLLAINAFRDDNLTHEQVFGDLANDEFTAQEAAEYLEVSMSTFRRYVQTGKLKASSELGRNQMFATHDLKAFKRALKNVKGTH
ncbi:DNA binding domain-containing protein, excisionase family [Collimonas sp. OK307]|uniref:helix-turn-helix domain-containing protein n=1 Tax=Collimonas sp. OK307 TaxID=1801620 RepID=UPI0008E39F04|nr:helix-turn-helix domain-containing protein [Collimonas sp. OK307]SFI25535.1 DNA binding domain-containing protein, excisionase family [Collimonas sp. OK307]